MLLLEKVIEINILEQLEMYKGKDLGRDFYEKV